MDCNKDPCVDRFDRLDAKLDSIDSKLDNHLERIAKTEVWVKGHTTIISFIVSGLIALATKLLMR